jgi:hypothetical protein
MTEAEWLACTDPQKMLEFLQNRASGLRSRALRLLGFPPYLPSDRKLRLFACACCRRTWHLLEDQGWQVVELAERDADGQASAAELQRVLPLVDSRLMLLAFQGGSKAAKAATYAAGGAINRNIAEKCRVVARDAAGAYAWDVAGLAKNASDATRWAPAWNAAEATELRGQAALLHDLFGPLPFRPVALDPAWLTWHGGAVPQLAQALYGDRHLPSGHFDPHRLAVLADAVVDAGCDNQEILNHCRQPGEHVRSCWVVDLLLGKS